MADPVSYNKTNKNLVIFDQKFGFFDLQGSFVIRLAPIISQAAYF